jgi:hypothetical protein
VSPLWRDEIGAYLAPHRLCLVRLKRGLKPSVAAEHEQSIEAGEPGTWAPVLAALDTLLADPAWQGARLRMVISDHWVRYAIVPWTAELSSAGERLAHARQLLASLYGEIVSDWDVRVSDAPPHVAQVACTIPAPLISSVRAICEKHAVKLVSLQPQLIAAYASHRRHLPKPSAWFVTVEQGSLAAAHIGDHGWDRVHTVRISPDWTRELKRLQAFGTIASNNPEEGCVYVDAPLAWREVADAAGKALRLHWLEEPSGPLSTLQHLGRVRRLAA